MKASTRLNKYQKDYILHIPTHLPSINDSLIEHFLHFTSPKLIKEFTNTFSNYFFNYYYNSYFKDNNTKCPNNSNYTELISDNPIGVNISYVFTKHSDSKINLLKKKFLDSSPKNSDIRFMINNIGFVYTVFYPHQSNDKIIISLKPIFLSENGLCFDDKKNENNFIISIKGIDKIKIYKHNNWISFTLNYLKHYGPNFDNKDIIFSNNILIELELIASIFKMTNNNEYLINILKDLHLSSSHFDYPKISLNKLRTINSKKDLFNLIYNFPYPKLLNNINWKKSLIFCEEIKNLTPKQISKLTQFYKHHSLNINTTYISNFYYRTISIPTSYNKLSFYNTLTDYIRMSNILNIPINLNIKSIKRLNIEHDRLAKEISYRNTKDIKLNIHERFLLIKHPLILIDNYNDLIYEGKRQHHCVASYYPNINQGEIAIYTIHYNSSNYTVEIGFNIKSKKFVLKQCEGKYRESPSDNLIQVINNTINSVIISDSLNIPIN